MTHFDEVKRVFDLVGIEYTTLHGTSIVLFDDHIRLLFDDEGFFLSKDTARYNDPRWQY